MPLVSAFIALGSNLGDRAANIRAALVEISATEGIDLTRTSDFLDNPAVGGPPESPPFLNAAAKLETTLSPRALLDRLLAIETAMGRTRRRRWEPRVIDLDLLLYSGQILTETGLTIPHPLMHERRFVLIPLAQIAPSVIHPVLGKTIRHILDELPPAP